ncbi:GNAT family N-acetyltransferase [Tropicimonas sp. IMCC34043]|uniref:GNAT family N-acetyltransferase n=1 Tax=Tropicimonas sp. IMCC34043 TaxID=2248760 RepID=UPI000E23632C|nr:GNAT family N-acetyltransferase [Tropicimonas sp. IMCC34043]
MSSIPLDIAPLVTDRLVLRAPVAADYPAFRDFYASDRSQFTGGPLDERLAWRGFSALLGHWLIHGFGLRTVTEKGSDTPLGYVGVWYPGTWPEPEIGWTLYPAAEGRGLGHEAASAVRDHVFATLGWATVVSYILPQNARSIALAERLGALRDDAATRPPHAPDCLVYRHPHPAGDGGMEAYA